MPTPERRRDRLTELLSLARIVQAALLCGPYAHPDALNRSVSLPADFSAIAPGGR